MEAPQKGLVVIAVLGHKLLPDNSPSEELKLRMKFAFELYEEYSTQSNVLFFLCGGLSSDAHTMTEGERMRIMCLEHGIDEKCIRLDTKSKTTVENFAYMRQLLSELQKEERKKLERVFITTSDYHACRTSIIAAHFLEEVSWEVKPVPIPESDNTAFLRAKEERLLKTITYEFVPHKVKLKEEYLQDKEKIRDCINNGKPLFDEPYVPKKKTTGCLIL